MTVGPDDGGDVADQLSITEAAEELGVHYMTAYRYVRLGMLPARKDGATWRIGRADLEQFEGRERWASNGPSARARTGEGETDSPAGRRPRRVRWAERYEARLLAGDPTGAWGVLEAAMASGVGREELYLEVISPAMEGVGRRWAAGEIDIAEEHVASSITMRCLGRIGPRFNRPGRSRLSVVIGGVPGERHSLPVALLADLLTGAGYHVVDLGADVPVDSFVHAGHQAPRLGAFGISMTAPDLEGRATEAVTTIRAAFPGVPVLAGGGAVGNEDHARRIGADHWAPDGRSAVAVLDDLASTRRG